MAIVKICKIHGELTEKDCKNIKNGSWKGTRCNLCVIIWNRNARKNNKIKKRVYKKTLPNKKINPELIGLSKFEKLKHKHLKRKFKISFNQYKHMMEEQNNLCAICNEPEKSICYQSKKTFFLSVDHCHKTGKIRKLLCNKCNVGLGSFKDDANILLSAIEYLKAST